MSTYDCSGFKSGDTENLASLISEINKLPTKVSYNSSSSILSVASSTDTTFVSQTITASSDDLILLVGHVHFSVSDGTGSTGQFRFFRGSTGLGFAYILESSVSSTNGLQDHRFILYYEENQSGSTTYNLKFARNTGSGTIYIQNGSIAVYQMKKK